MPVFWRNICIYLWVCRVSIILWKSNVYFSSTEFASQILSSSFLWAALHHMTTITELETLCHVHFLCDFKKLYVSYDWNMWDKIAEYVNTEEKILSRKTEISFVWSLPFCHLHFIPPVPHCYQNTPQSRLSAPQLCWPNENWRTIFLHEVRYFPLQTFT